jgi:hypothetical protein
MAKSKTTWEWRSVHYQSEAELKKHLTRLANEALGAKFGPPATERYDGSSKEHWIHFKVTVTMGPKPSKRKTGTSAVKAPKTAKNVKLSDEVMDRRRPPKGMSNDEYFGSTEQK